MWNHLHILMKRRTYWNYAKHLSGRERWFADLGPWSSSSNKVARGIKPWAGVVESGSAQIFPARIRYHM